MKRRVIDLMGTDIVFPEKRILGRPTEKTEKFIIILTANYLSFILQKRFIAVAFSKD